MCACGVGEGVWSDCRWTKSDGVRVIWISGAEANMSALGLASRTVTRFGAAPDVEGVKER